jgi:chromosome partitioning protein
VLNNADPNGQDNADAIAALADFPQLEYLPTPIRRRKPVANAAGQGLSVLEAVPKDRKASEEMNAFVNAVYKLI